MRNAYIQNREGRVRDAVKGPEEDEEVGDLYYVDEEGKAMARSRSALAAALAASLVVWLAPTPIAAEEADAPEGAEKPEKVEKVEKADAPEGAEKPEKGEKADVPEGAEKPEKVEKADVPEGAEKPEKVEKADAPEGAEKPEEAKKQAKGPPSPRAVIQETADEVLAILNQKKLSKDERRARLGKIVYARFDFTTMSKLVLARYWKRFDEAQRGEFVREYKTYLANGYGSRLDRYSGEKVEMLGERTENRGDVTVKTKIVGGEYAAALVEYRMRSKDGPWLVIDVIIEGVSMVSSYRDQFKEVLSNGGPAHLLEKLKEKNAAGIVDEV